MAENIYRRSLLFARRVFGRGIVGYIAVPARRRIFPPQLAHICVAIGLNLAWLLFFYVWGLRGTGDQEAFATIAIAGAALLSYRRIHWFMLRGSWYQNFWYKRRILGVRVFDWFDLDAPKSNPTKKAQREAVMSAAAAFDRWERRTALRVFPEEHSHQWEWTAFGPHIFFSCHCGLSLKAFESDFSERFTNDDVTRVFESGTRSTGWSSRRPDWPNP